MASHRIRLTDQELMLARLAVEGTAHMLDTVVPSKATEYFALARRLEYTKPGAMPAATRAARKLFRSEAPAP